MQNAALSSHIGAIYATLAKFSNRPRYAFLVLQLVTEAANPQGRAGPLVSSRDGAMLLRDWLCTQMLPMSERDGRRAALRGRIIENLQGQLTGELSHDKLLIDDAVEEQVLAVGRANISRAISDLVRAGFLSRHYAGYATNHANRGGGRHAVYVVEAATLSALSKSLLYTPFQAGWPAAQGQLFAA